MKTRMQKFYGVILVLVAILGYIVDPVELGTGIILFGTAGIYLILTRKVYLK